MTDEKTIEDYIDMIFVDKINENEDEINEDELNEDMHDTFMEDRRLEEEEEAKYLREEWKKENRVMYLKEMIKKIAIKIKHF